MRFHSLSGHLLLLSLAAGAAACTRPPLQSSLPRSTAHVAAETVSCTPPAAGHIRTILYFGLARPAGTVSEGEWQAFVRDEVTPRFPEGLTTWEVDGQWRRGDGQIVRERSKVLLLVHGETPMARAAIQELIVRYKQAFEQESVLWETTPVCVMF